MLIDNAVSQSYDGVTLLGKHMEQAASVEMINARNTVQMVPQEEVRSEHDLGFMTEVDAEYVAKTFAGGKDS